MSNTSKEYLELQKFFTNKQFPQSIKLDTGVSIPDVQKFVENNLRLLGSGEMNEVASAGRYFRMSQLMKLLIAGADK